MKKSYYFLSFLVLSLAFFSCGGKVEVNQPEKKPLGIQAKKDSAITDASFAEKVEATHKKSLFVSKELVNFDLDLWFGGNKRMECQITMSPDFSRIRMELSDGKVLIYDGEEVYQMGDTTEYKTARFDIFTWPYFFAFPFKLTDPGTNWENTTYYSLNGRPYASKKLTFDAGVGDAPDDWYIAYADKESYRLYAAAYIVTMGRDQEKAEEDPHAITYENYQMVEGVPIATQWGFWGWDGDQGLTKKLGQAEISNIAFLPMNEALFEAERPMKKIEK